MSFSAYRQSTEPKRLFGTLEQRGSRTGLSTGALALISILVLCMGLFIVLVGTKTVPVDPSTVHAPYWVLTAAGLVFAGGGAALIGQTWKQFASNRLRAQAMERHPNEPAFADHPWDTRGYTPSRARKSAKAIAGAAFVTVFASPFNWWAFLNHGPIPVKIGAGILDVFLLLVYWNLFLTVGRALKFGDSRIEFTHFPYRTNEPIELRWYAPSGITRATGGAFTLRCVKEWYERRGTGKNSSTSLIHEEQWSGTWPVDQPEEFLPGKGIEFAFATPPDLPPTRLGAVEAGQTRLIVRLPGHRTTKSLGPAETVVFWELEVKLQLPGLDFEEKYLVPVYEPASRETAATLNRPTMPMKQRSEM